MNRDQIRGASRHVKGRAQTTLGGLTGDPGRQVRGAVNQVAGGAQYVYGRARDRARISPRMAATWLTPLPSAPTT